MMMMVVIHLSWSTVNLNEPSLKTEMRARLIFRDPQSPIYDLGANEENK